MVARNVEGRENFPDSPELTGSSSTTTTKPTSTQQEILFSVNFSMAILCVAVENNAQEVCRHNIAEDFLSNSGVWDPTKVEVWFW